MESLTKKIQELKNISPDKKFRVSSRVLILASPQVRKTISAYFWESFRYSLALGLGSLIVIIALGGFSYLHLGDLSPLTVGGLNARGLASEAQNAQFEINIAEAKYFEDAAKIAAIALKVMSENTPDHINSEVLEKELNTIKLEKNNNQDIQNLLNKLIL